LLVGDSPKAQKTQAPQAKKEKEKSVADIKKEHPR
jgi:hypothetical protein